MCKQLLNSGSESLNATSWFLFKLMGMGRKQGNISHHQVRQRTSRVDTPCPAYFRKTKPIITRTRQSFHAAELSLAVSGRLLSWIHSCLTHALGEVCRDLRTRKPYPQKQCVPWQSITLGCSSALLSRLRSGYQRVLLPIQLAWEQLLAIFYLWFLPGKIRSCQNYLGWYFFMINFSSLRVLPMKRHRIEEILCGILVLSNECRSGVLQIGN